MKSRLQNIPIYIQPAFLIFFLMVTRLYAEFTAENGIIGFVLVFSLLLHEYGHALTAQYFGAEPEIHLQAFGGTTRYKDVGMTEKQTLIVILNGPLFESLLIAIPYLILKNCHIENYYVWYFLVATMKLNIVWCLFNLIPLFPLDGGQMLRPLLYRKFGDKGLKASIFIGMACGIVAIPYFLYTGYYAFVMLLVFYGFQNFRVLDQMVMSFNPFVALNEGLNAMKNNDVAKAKSILKNLLKENRVCGPATESYAEILVAQQEKRAAYDLLLRTDLSLLKNGKCLLCKLAYEEKNYELIESLSREIYEIEPTFEIALLNSKTYARLGNGVYAAGWLKTASMFENVSREQLDILLEDSAFDSVRANLL